MDIFKSMNQTKVADFSVFKSKKKNPVATEEQKEAVAEQNPVPQKESVAGRMTEKTVSPIKEEVPVEQAEKGDSVPEEFVPRENEKDNGNIIPFKQQENHSEEAAVKLEAELETAKSNLLPVFPIVRYLKNKCQNDATFAALVNDEQKTLAKCFAYVTSEVKKALNSQNGWLDDNEVYAYAETYYMTDEATFERLAAEKAEEEKKRQEEVARKRKEREEKLKKLEKERKKKNAKEKEKTVIKEESPQTENPEIQNQLCLQM